MSITNLCKPTTSLLYIFCYRLQWKTREQQKSLENELASREEFLGDIGAIRATIEGAQERLQSIHDADDDTLDLEKLNLVPQKY